MIMNVSPYMVLGRGPTGGATIVDLEGGIHVRMELDLQGRRLVN
jgi:hypothetical protein